MEGARLQGASGGEGPEQASSRDSPALRRCVPRHEHCSPSLRAGVGSWGCPRSPLEQRKPRALPGLWVSRPPPSLPQQEKLPAGKLTPTGLPIEDWQKCDSTSVPVPDGPSRHVQSHAGAPHSASPRRRHPAGFPRPGQNAPSPPVRPPRPVGQPRSQPLCARIPGVADANFREQKSCLQTVRELRGEPGRPGPRVLAPTPRPRARAQAETRRGAPPRPRPRHSSPCTRPGEAQTFLQGPVWLVPRAAL